MLQLEMEKASQQLEGIAIMNQILSKIVVANSGEVGHLGGHMYFLGTS
jgi:hypothetical protein